MRAKALPVCIPFSVPNGPHRNEKTEKPLADTSAAALLPPTLVVAASVSLVHSSRLLWVDGQSVIA